MAQRITISMWYNQFIAGFGPSMEFVGLKKNINETNPLIKYSHSHIESIISPLDIGHEGMFSKCKSM